MYNLFTGFAAEAHAAEHGDCSASEVLELVQPLVAHVELLSSGHAGFVNKYLAQLIQQPHVKTGVALLIRDTGGFFTEGGGTGKNLFLEWFGLQVLGEKYFQIIDDNKDLYDSFNSIMEGKLLVFVEEAGGGVNHAHRDTLKSKITKTKLLVNRKGCAQYTSNDYARYVFTTNNKNAMPIGPGDRRTAVFDADPAKRNDVAYFTGLSAYMQRPRVVHAYYAYLKHLETFASPIQCQVGIPKSAAYVDMRLMNAPLYHKWVVARVRDGSLQDASTTDLYANFVEWADAARERRADVLSQTAFGTLLSNASEVQRACKDDEYPCVYAGSKAKRHGAMFMRWDRDKLVDQLKAIFLLPPDFTPDFAPVPTPPDQPTPDQPTPDSLLL